MSESSFPALRVVQPLGEFYLAVLPADFLLEVTYSNLLTLLKADEDGDYKFKGSQRKLDPERLKAIGRYLNTVEAAVPNTIILAANYRESGEFLEQTEESEGLRWRVEPLDHQAGIVKLVIPKREKLAAIVDGQHRLYGFEFAEATRRTMPLVCSVYLDLPNPFQAQLFATINYNQKPVDKSQSYQLYGFNLDQEPTEAWSPEKAAVFLSRKLNTDPESPFEHHITIAAEDQRVLDQLAPVQKMGWAISTATVVEGLLRLFSANPKRDRDFMHTKEVGKGRSRQLLRDMRDASPLRQLYLDGNDLLLYTLARNYFAACAELFWDAQGEIGYIRKTVGVQALFDVLRRISPEVTAKKDVSKESLAKRLQPVPPIRSGRRSHTATTRPEIAFRSPIPTARP